jgi:hypothetical protein
MKLLCNIFKRKQHPKAAGLFFTDAIHVLAGWQPTKKTPIISGFGGTMEPNEDWQTTAIRETLEELLDISPVPPALIAQIKENLFYKSSSSHICISENYTYATFYFSDLITILQIVADYDIQSPIYPRGIPLTIPDLIFNRIFTPKSEIQQLVLLPTDKNIKLDPYFINDINSH